MENITFYEQINLFLENKGQSPWPTYIARVPESYKRQVFCIKAEVWNESHIVWEPFQTPIFQLYKALHGIFQKHTKNSKGKPKITRNSESKKEFFTKHP